MKTTQCVCSPHSGVSFDPCAAQTYRMCYTTLLSQKVCTSILPFRHRHLYTWKHPNVYRHTRCLHSGNSPSTLKCFCLVVYQKCVFPRKSVPSRSKNGRGKSLNLAIRKRRRAKQKESGQESTVMTSLLVNLICSQGISVGKVLRRFIPKERYGCFFFFAHFTCNHGNEPWTRNSLRNAILLINSYYSHLTLVPFFSPFFSQKKPAKLWHKIARTRVFVYVFVTVR